MLFYHKSRPYYEFTNFYKSPINIDGRRYLTTEHYFQGIKFPSCPDLQRRVREARTPRQAFQLARDFDQHKREDWKECKERRMMKALRAKFSQHPELRKLLLDTGSRRITAQTVNEVYQDDGGDGSGKNRLGNLLMQLRREV